MTINDRIRELRKNLGLSGEKFGEQIGLTRMAISNLETGKYNLTEQTILSICRVYNVSEQWLRTGEGEMFKNISTIPLDELLKDADELEAKIFKAYFSLDKDIREQIIKHFKEVIKPEL